MISGRQKVRQQKNLHLTFSVLFFLFQVDPAMAARPHCGTDRGGGGRLASTTYYLPTSCPKDSGFRAKVNMQGSVRCGSITYKYDGLRKAPRAVPEACPQVFNEPSTRGAGGVCLTPYFSIAAPLSKYPVGTIIFVPEIAKAKLKLPNGKIHPGYFMVHDTGGDIKGNGRFDFYTGGKLHGAKGNVFNGIAKLGMGDRNMCSKMSYQVLYREKDSGGMNSNWKQAQVAMEQASDSPVIPGRRSRGQS